MVGSGTRARYLLLHIKKPNFGGVAEKCTDTKPGSWVEQFPFLDQCLHKSLCFVL